MDVIVHTPYKEWDRISLPSYVTRGFVNICIDTVKMEFHSSDSRNAWDYSTSKQNSERQSLLRIEFANC
jgi:hypothetical protein